MVDGETVRMGMPETIEVVMMAMSTVILLVGKAKVQDAVKGSVFGAGMNAMVGHFRNCMDGRYVLQWQPCFLQSTHCRHRNSISVPLAVALFFMSIMLFSQAATVRTLYPLGIGLGIAPLALVAMFPAVNGYFFIPNYPTEVAAINFDRTGTTRIGRFVINHSFQLAGFITTFVSIGVGYLVITFLY